MSIFVATQADHAIREPLTWRGRTWRPSLWIRAQIRTRGSVLITPQDILDLAVSDAALQDTLKTWEGGPEVLLRETVRLRYEDYLTERTKELPFCEQMTKVFALGNYKPLWLWNELALRWFWGEVDRRETLAILRDEKLQPVTPAVRPVAPPPSPRTAYGTVEGIAHDWHLPSTEGPKKIHRALEVLGWQRRLQGGWHLTTLGRLYVEHPDHTPRAWHRALLKKALQSQGLWPLR